MSMDNLYVVKRTFINPKNTTEPTFDIALPATFTDLRAAKEEARNVLGREGYDPEFFTVYDVKKDLQNWKHGDEVVVYAEGSPGEVFMVEIDTVPNRLGREPGATGKIPQPLYHVLQTIIEYNSDRSGSKRNSILQGTFATRDEAKQYALQALLDADTKKDDFAEYDEYTDNIEGPFGQDVIVHAVKEGGENILVSVISDD